MLSSMESILHWGSTKATSNTSELKGHPQFFRLHMVLWNLVHRC